MTTRYFQLASGTFAVWDSMMANEAPKAGSTLIVEYNEILYPVIHAQLNASTKTAVWNAGLRTLTVDSLIVFDGAWIDARTTELQNAASVVTAQSGLKDKITLARDHADAIKRVFNMVLDQTIDQTTQPTRWNNIKAQIDHVSTASTFKGRFAKDVLEELGFDVNGALTAAQIRQITLYTRFWITGFALLLTEA